jgi:hypothetical protein
VHINHTHHMAETAASDCRWCAEPLMINQGSHAPRHSPSTNNRGASVAFSPISRERSSNSAPASSAAGAGRAGGADGTKKTKVDMSRAKKRRPAASSWRHQSTTFWPFALSFRALLSPSFSCQLFFGWRRCACAPCARCPGPLLPEGVTTRQHRYSLRVGRDLRERQDVLSRYWVTSAVGKMCKEDV